MGLNVIVQTLQGQQHPEWDDGRYAGDRELFRIADQVPRTDVVLDEGFGGANDWHWRPSDFDAFRAADWPAENAERWQLLADLLERDTGYWIYLSV